MSTVPQFVDSIPDEFKPATALCIGALLLVALVLFHGVCLHYILAQHQRGVRRLLSGRPHTFAASMLFGWTVFLMLDLHIAEILIWATVLTRTGLILRAADAIYFCANAYTTVGYGKVDVAEQWRNITPIISISGLFTFAWTTSALVNVVSTNNKLVAQLQDERSRQKQMRATLRKDEWAAVTKEQANERAEKLRARSHAAGLPFFERYKSWRDERKALAQLRRDGAAEVQTLRRKEHAEEEKLGPGPPADES